MTAVVPPDIQIGYYRNRDGTLEPTHDEKALAVAIRLIEELQPESIICVGDNLDLPEMGKYLTTPAYQQTTQASIDRATLFCAQMRAAAPDARIVWLAGNHEERMPKYLLTNAAAAYGLRKGHTPELACSQRSISLPYG
jgi:metallophosphoesterase superfamily enzyme